MTLLEKVKAVVGESGNTHPSEYADEIEGAKLINEEIYDSNRWSNTLVGIIKRQDEYVEVVVQQPATENQSWDDWDDWDVEVYAVIPKEVTTVRYVRA